MAGLMVALLGCMELICQGALLIRTSVVDGVAVVLAGMLPTCGVLWRMRFTRDRFRL